MNLKKRFENEDFWDISTNDQFRLICGALEQADLLTDGEDEEQRIARAIRSFRDGDNTVDFTNPEYMVFTYEGEEYYFCTQDEYEKRAHDCIESLIEDAKYEWEKAEQNHYFSNYLIFDADMMYRDMWLEKDEYISSYDGVMHEAHLNCIDDDGIIYSTGITYYFWRTS